MRQKDFTLIVVVVAISGVLAFVVANALFAAPQKRQLKVQVVDKINTDFQAPDGKYFNASSLNPTKQIRIGDNPNNNPFNSPQP